ncbi:MAG: nickel pincer cofactor biosynthesis protein LarB [Clostridia bacterium]|nr:nickel pincer cofactor biosynthesis protein LarB [Clostridia bacterium]NCC74855.1 nickel pincer cofactor biosynthesis protein LarB [Clostridia bacterium]
MMTEQFEDLGFAKVDHSRKSRNGFAEVVFCEGKTPEQAAQIAASILDHGDNLLATRADLEHFEAIQAVAPDASYSARARVITVRRTSVTSLGEVAVVSAGTADQPVAEEAALTAEALGCTVRRFSDVGVAGLHRLLAVIDDIRQADVIIAVAGMEGALVSVLGGLVDKPVLAVPSGIGYGANFGGVTTLLAMVNSCASGVAVLNIGNGFGAGFMAATICRQIDQRVKSALARRDSERQ